LKEDKRTLQHYFKRNIKNNTQETSWNIIQNIRGM